MCEEAGVRLVFLPAYSPDYNPIEQSFAQLKGWMRKHKSLAEEWGDKFEGFIQMALRCFMDNHDPRGHFRKSSSAFLKTTQRTPMIPNRSPFRAEDSENNGIEIYSRR